MLLNALIISGTKRSSSFTPNSPVPATLAMLAQLSA
jgi:hypothetical protein